MANHRIICLLWRPKGGVIRDGGFHRTYSILESLPADVPITLIDRYPSLLRSGQGVRVVEYRVPGWVDSLRARTTAIGGLAEALITFSLLLFYGRREVRRAGRCILYVPTSEIPWVTFAGALLAKVLHTRLVLANLNTRIELANKAGGLIGRLLWRVHASADQVIALSNAIATELAEVGVSENVSVNSCGFERPDYSSISRSSPRQGGIYVGRVEAAKGVNDLLDAWHLISNDFPLAELRLVGYASSQNRAKFVERVRTLGLDQKVHLLGVVADAAKWTLFAESRVCIFLSHIEGWGFVPLEALSVGLPVVVYDLPCYAESLRGLNGVFVVALGDTVNAAKRVTELLAMPDDAYATMSDQIRLSFDYPDWRQVASAELGLIDGTET